MRHKKVLSDQLQTNCDMIERDAAGNIFFNQLEDIKCEEFLEYRMSDDKLRYVSIITDLKSLFLFLVTSPKLSNGFVRKRIPKGKQQH